MSACSVQVRPLRPWSTCWGLEGDSIIASLRVMEMKMEMEMEMAKEKQQPRKSGRIPSSSYRMPSQMKTLFFDDAGRKKIPKNFTQLHANPAIYLVHNFLSKRELEYFDIMCTHYGPKFKNSFTGTDNDEEVVSEERTSKFISLSKSQDKFVRGIEQKSAGLVGLSPLNVEPLQIVSYGPGQRFNLHHDAGTLLEDGSIPAMIAPRRLITIFLYLHSLPEGEGHTEFPRLTPPLSVRPQRNCALMFCNSTLNTHEPNPLLVHCAQPLSSHPCRHPSRCHRKLGVNIWLTDTDLGELAGAKSHTPLPQGTHLQRKKEKQSPQHSVVTKKKRKLTEDTADEEATNEIRAVLLSVNDKNNNRGSNIKTKSTSEGGWGVLVRAEQLYEQWLVASQTQTTPLCGGDENDNCACEQGKNSRSPDDISKEKPPDRSTSWDITPATSSAVSSSSRSTSMAARAAAPCSLLSLSLVQAQDRLDTILASREKSPNYVPVGCAGSSRDSNDSTITVTTGLFGVTRQQLANTS